VGLAILEGVGASAYLAAAADIANPDYLTVASSTLTVGGHHSSYLRASLSEVPTQLPLVRSWTLTKVNSASHPRCTSNLPANLTTVHSLAIPFFCLLLETNPLFTLGIKAFPRLAVSTTGPITTNSTTILETSGYVLTDPGDNSGGALFITGPIFVSATPVPGGHNVAIPPGVSGQPYVVLTSCNEKERDETTAAGLAILEVVSW
jgi:hypothetical protein